MSFLPSALGQCPCVRIPSLPSAPACPLVAMLRGRPPVTSDFCRPLHLSPLLSPSSGLRPAPLRRLDPSWLTLPVASREPLSSSQNPCSPSLLGFWVPACLYPGEEERESLVPTQSLGGLGHPPGAEVRAAWPAGPTHGPLGQRWRRHQCQTCGYACSQGHQAASWTHLGHLHPWGGLAILGTSPSSFFLSLPPLWPGSGASPCSPGSNSLSLSLSHVAQVFRRLPPTQPGLRDLPLSSRVLENSSLPVYGASRAAGHPGRSCCPDPLGDIPGTGATQPQPRSACAHADLQ